MSFGVAMRVKVGGDELFDALPGLLPLATVVNAEAVSEAETFSLLPPDEQHGYRCLVGSEVTLESAEAGPVLKQFSGELMKHVANYCPNRVFVHAGVVGWKGRALVLPGTSFAGKTT